MRGYQVGISDQAWDMFAACPRTHRKRWNFYTIEVLGEAINNERQVAFKYNDWGTDKKLHPRKDDDGNEREYIINPYQMVATNGRYYLICNYDKYNNAANYRIDRITDIRMLDTPVKPMKKYPDLSAGLICRSIWQSIYICSPMKRKGSHSRLKSASLAKLWIGSVMMSGCWWDGRWSYGRGQGQLHGDEILGYAVCRICNRHLSWEPCGWSRMRPAQRGEKI